MGLVLVGVSLLVVPVLSDAQRRVGKQLGSASAVAAAKQTLLCTYLSAVLLLGLAADAAFGWWWADPAAALVIAAVAIKRRLGGLARTHRLSSADCLNRC